MNFKQAIAGAAIGCTLGITGIGLGSGVGNAAPCDPAPGVQCGPGGPGGPPPHSHPGAPPPRPGDNDWRGRFHGAPWGNDLPPWGWGAPPAPPWDGPLPDPSGPPPAPINYWGFQEQPVWDQGYNQWGFWFFGIWIPLPI